VLKLRPKVLYWTNTLILHWINTGFIWIITGLYLDISGLVVRGMSAQAPAQDFILDLAGQYLIFKGEVDERATSA